ncbi:MAG: type I restriction endonuclease subunit R [Chloroflexi bacterium]|nr:type I restriction endonuclease subunit R [Chloroflexota bacterium]
MPTDYKEKAFETAIEESLLNDGGYTKADPKNFDRERAIDPTTLIPFVRETQPDKWKALEQLHGANTQNVVIEELCKAMDSRGSLDVIRHGFKCFGKLLEVAFFRPSHGLNPETQKLYNANRLTITRQLHYSTKNENSIDVVLSLNGLPIVTAEIKNPMTGQTVNHAMHQYKNDRDPRELIFQFKKRTLVHFAVDPDLAYMTTQLSGKSTYFLPFNLGNNLGAGNPECPGNYRTWYLWEQVWQRDSILDIIGRFLNLEVKERTIGGKTVRKETMIFPRYHQLDSVRKLEFDAGSKGPGHN